MSSQEVCVRVFFFSMDDQKKNRTLLKFFADEKNYRIKRDGGPSKLVAPSSRAFTRKRKAIDTILSRYTC